MFKKGFLFILICLMVFLTGCAQAATENDASLEKVKEKGVFVVGLDDNFPPMGFRDGNNDIVGFDIDLAKEVSKRLNVEVKFQPIDWSANQQELNTGNIDCLWNGLSITPAREESMKLSKPYMNNNMMIVIKKDAGMTNLDSLKDKRLALQGGSTAEVALDDKADLKKSLKEVVYFKDNIMALMDLDKGGVDAVLMDDVAARYYIKNNDKDFVILDESLSQEKYAVGFRKGDIALCSAVENALSEIKKDGTLAKISNDWFGKDITVFE